MRGRDITGQKFGMLTAMYPTDSRNNGSVVWHFMCDCGQEADKPLNSVTSGKLHSCGCLRGQHNNSGESVSGLRFGKLTAVEPTSKRIRGSAVWKFRCDCGNDCEHLLVDVRRGNTRSCGCLKRHKQIDGTGQKFGYLTAISPTDKIYRGGIVWKFRCFCGNEIERPLYAARAGKVKSCGCMRYSGLRNHK